MPIPISIGETDYYEGNESELTAAGNVAVTTTAGRLFLRGPLASTRSQGPTWRLYVQVTLKLGTVRFRIPRLTARRLFRRPRVSPHRCGAMTFVPRKSLECRHPSMRPITLILMAAMASFAQAPVFEVASVKQNTAGGRMSVESSADRFTAFDIGLGPLVLMAYDLNVRQISGLDHTFDDRYDIVAKAERRVGSREMRQMLQSLLADRFKLQVHWETREAPVYSLTVAKGGPKSRHSDLPEDDLHGRQPAPVARRHRPE
jgi:Protein of unknown function (DUF3738)